MDLGRLPPVWLHRRSSPSPENAINGETVRSVVAPFHVVPVVETPTVEEAPAPLFLTIACLDVAPQAGKSHRRIDCSRVVLGDSSKAWPASETLAGGRYVRVPSDGEVYSSAEFLPFCRHACDARRRPTVRFLAAWPRIRLPPPGHLARRTPPVLLRARLANRPFRSQAPAGFPLPRSYRVRV
ncbi:hypothetical protein BH24CHL4_BH24CHL4_14580 [soil metagenome]